MLHNYNKLVALVPLLCHNADMAKHKKQPEDDPVNATQSKKPRTGDRHKPRAMIAFPSALYAKLAELAERNRRPIQWEAIIAIENHLKANE